MTDPNAMHQSSRPTEQRSTRLGLSLSIAGFILGAAAMVYPLAAIWSCYTIPPPGTTLQTEGLKTYLILGAAMGLIVALPVSSIGLWKSRRNGRVQFVGFVAVLISAASILSGYTLFALVVSIRHLVLVD